jgi:hypothetical protein
MMWFGAYQSLVFSLYRAKRLWHRGEIPRGKEHIRKLQADAFGHLFPKHNICKDKECSHPERI